MNSYHSFGHSASSPSSRDAESHAGTPDTKLTTFSPEDIRSGPRVTANSGIKVNLPPPFTLQNVPPRAHANGRSLRLAASAQDPFTSSSSVLATNKNTIDGLRLSPTALSFTPLASTKSQTAKNLEQNRSALQQGDSTTSADHLRASPVPDANGQDTMLRHSLLSVPAEPLLSPIGQRTPFSPTGATPTENSLSSGKFSNLGESSRYLMVSHVLRDTTSKEIDEVFNTRNFISLKQVITVDLMSAGIIYVRFADLRDANMAYSGIHNKQTEWHVQYIGAKHYVLKDQPDNFLYTSAYEGQVYVTATYTGPLQRFDAGVLGHVVKELLENYGDLAAFHVSYTASPTVAFQAEFYNTTSAAFAVSSLDAFKIASCLVTIFHYSPDIVQSKSDRERHHGPFIIGYEGSGLDNAMSQLRLDRRQGVSEFDPSLTKSMASFPRPSPSGSTFMRSVDEDYQNPPLSGRHGSGHLVHEDQRDPSRSPYYEHFPVYGMQVIPWALYGLGAVGQERVSPDFPGYHRSPFSQQCRASPGGSTRQNHEYVSTHHNVVDVERIRQGLDVRTTIMLRNIPNKIDQAMLKEIVDETSRGKYDFMYLRIDFANNCNVGYAFINFEDPWFIIDFVNARAGHRWNRYNSDKVAEVSYATIQGKDCLVQKFRNSSVMLEHPSFRPKIFRTGTDVLTGEEDAFPGPDNPSKMRRSVENAEHVGLFAPRAGQHFRDEQRRRRSQYDRGTRLAELEDAYDFDDRDRYEPFVQSPADSSLGSYGKITQVRSRGY